MNKMIKNGITAESVDHPSHYNHGEDLEKLIDEVK